MARFYSQSTGGFYESEFRLDYERAGTWPEDAREITVEEEEELRRPVPLTRSELVSGAWLLIKAKRDAIKAGGVKVGAKWFHTDDASRIQHMALNMMGANIPANLQWKTMDGSFVTMTQALAGQVFQAVATLDMNAFAVAEQHRVAMEASAEPASYDFSTGWPETFAG